MAACQICDAKSRRAIDAALGVPKPNISRVAKTFGTDYQATRRHLRNGHVAGMVAEAHSNGQGATGEALGDVDAIGMLRDRLDAMRRADLNALSAREQREQMESIRRAADTLSRIAPAPPSSSVSVEDVIGLPELIAGWAQVLEPYPEARAAMAEVTRRLGPGLMTPRAKEEA